MISYIDSKIVTILLFFELLLWAFLMAAIWFIAKDIEEIYKILVCITESITKEDPNAKLQL